MAREVAASGVISGIAAAAQGTINMGGRSNIAVVITGLTSETVYMAGCVNAAVFTSTSGIRPFDLATGAVKASNSLMANGEYLFSNMSFEQIKFVKSSTSETPVISWRMW